MKPLSCAVLLLLGLPILAQDIFLHPKPRGNDALRTLDPSQANVVLTHHLGLEQSEEWHLHQEDSAVNQYLLENSPEAFVAKQIGKTVVVSVESSSLDFLPDSLRNSRSSISVPTDVPFSFDSLISTYLHQATRLFRSIRTSRGRKSAAPQTQSYKSSKSLDPFMDSLSPLMAYIGPQEDSKGTSFGAFEVSGLAEIETEHGLDSNEYRFAIESLRSALNIVTLSTSRLAVLVSPPSSYSPHNEKRQEHTDQPPQAPLPGDQSPIPPQEPFFSISTCHRTEDDCKSSTDSCSGHGTCTNATRTVKGVAHTCFVCACSPTVDKGRKTVWVGAACEKVDVSVQFGLLAGTALVLIVLTVGTVYLLPSIGYQELPKTLTASASGGHLKSE